VTAAGARARVVRNSPQRLEQIKAQLDRSGGVAGASWSVDAITNTVTVNVPEAASDARTNAFVASLRAHGNLVQVRRTAAAPVTHALLGGDAILGEGFRCSAAFNAENGSGQRFLVTAGHCTDGGSNWTTGGRRLGTTYRSSFPGNDYGIIRITNSAVDPRGAVRHNGGSRAITSSGGATPGTSTCKTGSTTGTTCGTVQATGVTVNYGGGDVVYGMIQTNVCTQAGDSGGALYAGSRAQGIVSGGTNIGCGSPRFQSFFNPIGEALSGLRLL
jgi:hypothetical protein